MARKALEGIRVLKLASGIAGPLACRFLSDAGAEVIRVESLARRFIDRAYVPPWEPELGRETGLAGPMQNDYNAGDLSVVVEMTRPKGFEVFKRLVKISDVVLVCYSAPTAAKLGIDYPVLREIKPDIIMLNMPGFGVKGPYYNYVSWGINVAPLTGISSMIGYPDLDEPMGVGGMTLPDFTGGHAGFFCVLNALHYRARTGKGQYIDLAQFTVAASTIGPAILDYTDNGNVAGFVGNRSPHAAPHGVYRCRGEDRWCAIAVRTEEEWEGFCRAVGNPGWTSEPRFATLRSRLENHDDLDRLVEEFTSQHDPYEAMFLLQQEGVPAGVVQMADDLLMRDVQLAARGFYVRTEDLTAGSLITHGTPIKMSATPGVAERGQARFGQDNDYVLKELLGMSDGEVEELVQEGVVGPMEPPDPRLKDRSLTARWKGVLATSLPPSRLLRWR